MPGVVGPAWQRGGSAPPRWSRPRRVRNAAIATPSAMLATTRSALRTTRELLGAPGYSSRLQLASLVGDSRGHGGLGTAAGDLDVEGARAEGRVPGLERVAARRQARELECAALVGDGECGVVLDHGVGVHPGVDVALDVDHVAGACAAVEDQIGIPGGRWLVPGRLAGDRAVHVVERGV